MELPPFTPEQIEQLAQLHHLQWTREQVQRIQQLIGGHPYLVRLAMYHLSQNDLSFEQLFETAGDNSGLFRDHLRGYWWKLQKNADLAQAFAQVLQADEPISLEPEPLFQLHSLGLVDLYGNQATPRCDLYRQYFRNKLTPHV